MTTEAIASVPSMPILRVHCCDDREQCPIFAEPITFGFSVRANSHQVLSKELDRAVRRELDVLVVVEPVALARIGEGRSSPRP